MEWKEDVPRWIQVYEVIKGRIDDWTYPPGTKLPSILKLQDEFGIATATAQKVLHKLREDGLTRMQPGLGTFVRDVPKSEGT